ncbi:hypothetical protein EP7_001035 [Isosphaeraceae bacterium EP7]
MRRIQRSSAWALALGIAVIAPGCGDSNGNPGAIPASTDSASTHAFIENPGGIKEKPSARSKAAAQAMPPQPVK